MKYIAYYRVSTDMQGEDGNGIKPRKASVGRFLADDDKIIDKFKKVESGVLGVMASMVEHEAEVISKRTSEGIAQSDVYKSGNWGNHENLTKV